MSKDDWQVGDLALYVGAIGARYDHFAPLRPRKGCVYTVTAVLVDARWTAIWVDRAVSTWGGGGWNAMAFRKIHPHAPDAEDAEVIAILTAKPATVTA